MIETQPATLDSNLSIDKKTNTPVEAKHLIANLERRGRLLELLRSKRTTDHIDTKRRVPEEEKELQNILVKPNFHVLLKNYYSRIDKLFEDGKISSFEVNKNKKNANIKIFVILNRFGSKNTSPITSMFARALSSIDLIQDSELVKDLTTLKVWCVENKVEINSITGLYNGKGMPNVAELVKDLFENRLKTKNAILTYA